MEALSMKYPKSVEPYYYLGVSRLLLNENESAVRSLDAARALADDNLRDDISWYLALAMDHAGRTEDARRELQALCGAAGEYQSKACAAVQELRQ
jgi:thioredoxin-like negative regulator of GroEL